MRQNSILKKIKWSLVSVAVWTMSFAPAAMGQQQTSKFTVEQLQENIKTLGLNKKMTLGQFYEKNKNLMPERVRKEVEIAISNSRNVLMPSFEVVSAKATTGETVPTIRVSTDRELVNIQWFGEKNKVVKYQAANLSEIDITNFNDMFSRILATDEKLRAQYEPKPVARMLQTFNYPDVTRAEWKTMSARARAAYVVNLRTLWQQARAVLSLKEKSKQKRTSQFELKNNLFFELFFGQDANARTARRAATASASSCVVAGYTSEYENGVCSVGKAKNNFAGNDLTRLANERCASVAGHENDIACNPLVYGTPAGNPICLTPSRTDARFQRATLFDGPCDTQSRLQSSETEVSLLTNDTKREGRYEANNLRVGSVAALEAEFRAEAANVDKSKEYILGVLKFRGLTTETDFNRVVLNDDSLEKIRSVREDFNREINSARESCVRVANAPGSIERNYLLACDQLHRRFLLVDAALESRCIAGGLTYNPATLKCSCTIAAAPPAPVSATPVPSPAPAAPPATPDVVPGGSCRAVASTATVVTPPAPPAAPAVSSSATVSTTSPLTCDEEVSNPDCTCASGAAPRGGITDRATGAVADLTCAAGTTARDVPRNCNLLCKIGRGMGSVFKTVVNYAPVLLAAGVSIYLLTKLAPKKPALAAPADKCPNGSIAPCAQQCTGNMVPLPTGSCGCPSCVLGQVPNSSCQCVSRTTSSDSTGVKRCGDGTYVNTSTPCPTYACWNGSSYENPTQCPSQLPSADATRVRTDN